MGISIATEAKELEESENWQWEPDGIVYRPYTAEEVAAFNKFDRMIYNDPSFSGQMKKAVPLSSFSDAEKLAGLTPDTSGMYYGFYEVDMDLIDWFLNSAYDAQTKYNYFNSLEKTPSEVYQWVINSMELTDAQKMVYFRGHSIVNISPELQEWWYQTIGKPLTTEQTTSIDTDNYEAYRENQNKIKANGGIYQSGTEAVIDSNKKYYVMAVEDFNDAKASGLIASDHGGLQSDEEMRAFNAKAAAQGDAGTAATYYFVNKEAALAKYKMWND